MSTLSKIQSPILSILLQITLVLRLVEASPEAIAGYTPYNDVSEHAKIDLDMQEIADAVGSSNFSAALLAYTNGGNSLKTSDGAVTGIRTIQGFSSTAGTNLANEVWYERFRSYWSDDSYADTFTSSACEGTGDFTPSTSPIITEISRGEGCKKGAQYQNIWMYTIHEMEAAIEDCNNGVVGMHWDEAVAFYTGSLPGPSGTLSIGELQYALAEKRCGNFDTCLEGEDDDSAYTSKVNNKVFELFEVGKGYQFSFACSAMEATKEALVTQFAIPVIQGTLRYLYLADIQGSEKQRAELWAFSAAILPFINFYGASVATTLRSNTELTNVNVVPSGYAQVKYELETLYPAMGITCADIGGLASSAYPSGYFPGMEPCEDASTVSPPTTTAASSGSDDNNAMPDYGIALLVIFLTIALCAAIAGVYYFRKSQNLHVMLSDNERIMQGHSGLGMTPSGDATNV